MCYPLKRCLLQSERTVNTHCLLPQSASVLFPKRCLSC